MSSFFDGLASGGLKINISLTGSPETHPESMVYLRRRPNWKVRKNVFSGALKTPMVAPLQPISSPQLDKSMNIVVYSSDMNVEGLANLTLPRGKKLDHLGVQVKFFGRIEMESGAHEGRPIYDFISLSKELLPPGTLYDSHPPVPFNFKGLEMMYESYHGRNVSVRYFVQIKVQRQWLPPITKDHEVLIQIKGTEPAVNNPIKMEVGIEDCLHIEFEYERRCYHTCDVICGKINFLLVRIKIKHMELAVIRRETSGEGVAMAASSNIGGAPAGSGNENHNIVTETQTLLKYEIMDGAPVKGEMIPVRLHLMGIPADITPTYNAENNRFSVRYFLNLVLVDEEDRRYFKQQEIILWRKDIG